MKTCLDDLKSHKLTLTEAVNMAESQPVWSQLAMSEHGSEPASLESAGYEWRCALLCCKPELTQC